MEKISHITPQAQKWIVISQSNEKIDKHGGETHWPGNGYITEEFSSKYYLQLDTKAYKLGGDSGRGL